MGGKKSAGGAENGESVKKQPGPGTAGKPDSGENARSF